MNSAAGFEFLRIFCQISGSQALRNLVNRAISAMTAAFDPLLGKAPSVEEEDTISLVSGRTHNTGFTSGTGAFRGTISGRALVRMLDRGVDEHVIRHVVTRGTKQKVEDQWRFEKDGVVVVSTTDDPTMDVISSWFRLAFREEKEAESAKDAYEGLLAALDSAVDEEDRLVQLQHAMPRDSCSSIRFHRIFHGLDLCTRPVNRPLLLHCAASGCSVAHSGES